MKYTKEEIGYEMSKEMAENILLSVAKRKFKNLYSKEAQKTLCSYVDSTFCLKGNCVQVKVR